MSTETGIETAIPASPLPAVSQADGKRWYTFLRSPLWICLLLALLVRVFLIIYTHAIIDGDEALVGIQSEKILQGILPVYYYAQPYMGSLEAYLIALLFAIFGPSTWVMRAEATLVSLLVVWLTWRFAAALADAARLPAYAKRYFMIFAALLAAVPPLYDTVIEIRTFGGYIETFVCMLLLLTSILRLTQRWHEGASSREIVLRWAGIGFVVGLGLWIYPLISSAILASATWIACDRIVEYIRLRKELFNAPRRFALATLNGLLKLAVAIPTALLGFSPGIIWGASNQWANIAYFLQLGHQSPPVPGSVESQYHGRIALTKALIGLYTKCTASRVVSGALPFEGDISAAVHIPLLVIGVASIVFAFGLVAFSFIYRRPFPVYTLQLVALPMLFAVCTAFAYCISSAAVNGLWSCEFDPTGRYTTPLLLSMPFFIAASLTFISIYIHEKSGPEHPQGDAPIMDGAPVHDRGIPSCSPCPQAMRVLWKRVASLKLVRMVDGLSSPWGGSMRSRPLKVAQGIVFAFLALYLCVQFGTYGLADPTRTFQSPYCVYGPGDFDPIISYLQREHVHYVWAVNFIAYPIVLKTNSQIIAADPRSYARNLTEWNRIPENIQAVLHADRPTMMAFVHSNDAHPQILQMLDQAGITYQVARFPSGLEYDVIVVTPLNRTYEPYKNLAFADLFLCRGK